LRNKIVSSRLNNRDRIFQGIRGGKYKYALGKWHLTPTDPVSAAGPYDRGPLGRGFAPSICWGLWELLGCYWMPQNNVVAERQGFEKRPSHTPSKIDAIVDKSRYWGGFCASLHISDDTCSYRLVTAKNYEKCSQSVAKL
jgi:hypothetical protein